jgi:hypothetical protein
MRDALQYAEDTVEECRTRLRALREEQAHAATELKATQAEVYAHTHTHTHTHTHAATELKATQAEVWCVTCDTLTSRESLKSLREP